jgi:2-polyprenyl-6-hydroxyphenyl methylase / 3-demethylubiquinone-9 3-methyltransferase
MQQAVDPKEVLKFNQIARSYWDPEGPMRALHQINPLRIDFTESFYPLEGATVLDVGCGGGLASEALARRGAQVTAIDASPDMLKTAQLHAAESGVDIDYQHTHAESLATTHAEQFDLVTCFEMIEHVPDPQATLAALAALVRPGGHLIVSTINRTPKAYLGVVVAAEYILNWVPKGTHDYARFLKPSEIAQSLRPHGMDVTAIEGVVMHPLYRQFQRSKTDLDMNYQLAARKSV